MLYLLSLGVFGGLWAFYSDKSQWTSESLIQSEWHGEDAQHLDSMPADILVDTPKKSKKVDVPDVPLKLPEELLDFD